MYSSGNLHIFFKNHSEKIELNLLLHHERKEITMGIFINGYFHMLKPQSCKNINNAKVEFNKLPFFLGNQP